jgi:hypothetical protein
VHLPRNTRLETARAKLPALDKASRSKDPCDRLISIVPDLTGRGMKVATGLLAAVMLIAGAGAGRAFVITEDRGGRIGTYVDKYESLKSSGESVMIDGLCASACTIVLGAVPRDKICVTSRASLGFHAAWDFGSNGRTITNPEATQMLYSMYPPRIKQWIAQRGGLTPRMIFLRGRQLANMYRPCYLDAQASSRDASSRDASSRGASSRDVSSRDVSSHDVPSRDVLSQPSASRIRDTSAYTH